MEWLIQQRVVHLSANENALETAQMEERLQRIFETAHQPVHLIVDGSGKSTMIKHPNATNEPSQAASEKLTPETAKLPTQHPNQGYIVVYNFPDMSRHFYWVLNLMARWTNQKYRLATSQPNALKMLYRLDKTLPKVNS